MMAIKKYWKRALIVILLIIITLEASIMIMNLYVMYGAGPIFGNSNSTYGYVFAVVSSNNAYSKVKVNINIYYEGNGSSYVYIYFPNGTTIKVNHDISTSVIIGPITPSSLAAQSSSEALVPGIGYYVSSSHPIDFVSGNIYAPLIPFAINMHVGELPSGGKLLYYIVVTGNASIVINVYYEVFVI